MREQKVDTGLMLTKEEALGLLDLVLLSPGDLTPEQRTAAMKLSDYCRSSLRDADDRHPAYPAHAGTMAPVCAA
jgi:hypothetical protein